MDLVEQTKRAEKVVHIGSFSYSLVLKWLSELFVILLWM